MAQPEQLTDKIKYSHLEDPLRPGETVVKVVSQADPLAPTPSVQIADSTNFIYKSAALLNGSSESMAVNGSVTPVHFDFSPGSGENWVLEALTIFCLDNGSTDPNDFGAIAGSLTNGLRLLITKSSVDYELANMKNNRQITQVFAESPAMQSAGAGWFNSNDCFAGSVSFKSGIYLAGATDRIRATVRDDLSTFDVLSIFAKLRRVL